MWEGVPIFVNKISYMVELLLASIIFIVPAKKRDFFTLRLIAGSLLLLLFAWCINTYTGVPEGLYLQLVYWPLFIIVLVPFIWFCIDTSLGQAVYCVAMVSAVQHITFNLWILVWSFGLTYSFTRYVIYIACYISAYYCVAKQLIVDRKYTAQRADITPIVTIVLIVCTVSVIQGYPGHKRDDISNILYRISELTCCAYILVGQVRQRQVLSLQKELNGIQFTWEQQREQYQITQSTIDTINRKCHDLRHMIHIIKDKEGSPEQNEYLNELESAVKIYDTAIRTGSEPLDVLLMEKELYCVSHGIQMSCMIDGAKLSFMQNEDLYAMFGNALDNAITAVLKLDNPQERVISLNMLAQDKILMIQIQNYYCQALEFSDGLPLTTNQDTDVHGYGMKSIRYTAEKYNGTVTVNAKDGVFCLKILLPAEI